MQAQKIICAPFVCLIHAISKTGRRRISQLDIGGRARYQHFKIPIGQQKICQKNPNTKNDILFPQTVSFRTRVGILRIVPLIDIYFDRHMSHPLFSFVAIICKKGMTSAPILTRKKIVFMSFDAFFDDIPAVALAALEREDKNRIEPSTLYLVATPIGNLDDLSLRAIKVLAGVDFIAAEDTRNSARLLAYLGISKPMVSYHEHNRRERGPQIIERLKEGQSCALITDAGTPAISDPGEDLVALCAQENVAVTGVPGCCAGIDALTLSGLPTKRFCFEGFLSVNKAERREQLARLQAEERTMLLHEAPHKLRATLKDLAEAFGENRRISLCRELTKRNEEIHRTTIGEAVAHYQMHEPRGEYVLVVEGGTCLPGGQFWQDMSLSDHVRHYMSQGMRKNDAIKAAAHDRNLSKNEVYQQVLDL